MTPEERSILQSFLADLTATPNVTVDAEAEAMIQDAVRANPHAAYLLVQHAILADQALHAAQAQLASRDAPSSFLSPGSTTSVPAPSSAPTVSPADAPAMAPGGSSG